MVSLVNVVLVIATTLAAIVVVTPTQAQHDTIDAVGDYYRPSGDDVSGFAGATTPYRRSPCPALNALANHGHLPRNGQNITRAMIKKGIMSVYNIGEGVSDFLVSRIPEVISLDFLSAPNNVEHDASLVHYDGYTHNDPSRVDPALLADLLGRANAQGRLGIHELAITRKLRAQTCRERNPQCDLGFKMQRLAFAEASLLLLAFSDSDDTTISTAYAASFLLEEKIPADYTRPATDVSAVKIATTMAKIKALSVFE